MTNPEIVKTVGVVVLKEDEVLLVWHTTKADAPEGVVGLPAGKVGTDETLVQAAIRELREETGLYAFPGDLAELPTKYDASIDTGGGNMVSMHMTVFKCSSTSGIIDGKHETIPFWEKRGEIYNHMLRPNVDKAIEEAAKYVSNNI